MLHHHTRYDDVDHLHSELDHERRYRESIEWSNAELERSINELTVYLSELETTHRTSDDNEWKVRFESQTALNKQMQDQKDFLESELVEARRRLATGTYPEAMNFNLDSLNEPELLRLVKHLERMRNDFYSTLRDTEWKLDKESKEFHHFDEMRRVYRADLKHANHAVERFRMGVIYDPELGPVYPGYYNRDRDNGGGGGGGAGGGGGGGGGPSSSYNSGSGGNERKKSQKKNGGGGGKNGKDKGHEDSGEREQQHHSPTRSKSRMEKKSKKKEKAPPPAAQPAEEPRKSNHGGRKGSVATQNNNNTKHQQQQQQQESETEAGNASDATEADPDVREKQSVTSSTAETFTISITKEESEEKSVKTEG